MSTSDIEPTTLRLVELVLSGDRSYDSLDADGQAAVRAAWSERMSSTRAGLNYEREFRARGESWVEADPDGTPRHRT